MLKSVTYTTNRQSDAPSHPVSNETEDPTLVPKVGDIVVVEYITKKKVLTYLGLIQTADKGQDDYMVQ